MIWTAAQMKQSRIWIVKWRHSCRDSTRRFVDPPLDRHFGSRKIITIQGTSSSHGAHLPGNRWGCLHPFGGMVFTHAGQNFNGRGLHASAGGRTIGVSDCLRRIGTGTRYRFSLAAVSSSRSRLPAVPVLTDSRMSCSVSDSWVFVVQRNSNHNIRPRSDRMDSLCRSGHFVLEGAVKAMLLLSCVSYLADQHRC